ncbi:hypothetical protein GDO86_003343 [Hymenochirus boettgeri]|uniref:Kisspeptin n=1 Tax=Hymenochirus boettgeri TaxID=247094 RepID=A0A8T2K4K4_9PIPI|nr:hypothetical protein GDO86_003343 [Hymenochirus boettgeri]
MILSAYSLFFLLLGAHMGRCDQSTKNTDGFISQAHGQNQWLSSLPCPDKMSATWKGEQTPVLALLCWRKKPLSSGQQWSADSPLPSRSVPAPEGEFLMEREKDLSTYNWNSFGLRYGKRQSRAVKSKAEIF